MLYGVPISDLCSIRQWAYRFRSVCHWGRSTVASPSPHSKSPNQSLFAISHRNNSRFPVAGPYRLFRSLYLLSQILQRKLHFSADIRKLREQLNAGTGVHSRVEPSRSLAFEMSVARSPFALAGGRSNSGETRYVYSGFYAPQIRSRYARDQAQCCSRIYESIQ
jgi:hypothetical protein